jgi:hypothetical protein
MHRQEYALHPNEWDGWGLPELLKKEREEYRWKREDVWRSCRKENGGEQGDGFSASSDTTIHDDGRRSEDPFSFRIDKTPTEALDALSFHHHRLAYLHVTFIDH